MEGSEWELAAAWKEGDTQAGEALADRYFDRLLGFFRRRIPNEAEELTQRTMLACLEFDPARRRGGSYRSFVFGAARIELLRSLEGRGKLRGEEMMSRISIADLYTSPSERLAKQEVTAGVHRAMANLSIDDQILIEMVYWKQLTLTEAAAVLSIKPGAARVRLHRAKDRLAKLLAKDPDISLEHTLAPHGPRA